MSSEPYQGMHVNFAAKIARCKGHMPVQVPVGMKVDESQFGGGTYTILEVDADGIVVSAREVVRVVAQ